MKKALVSFLAAAFLVGGAAPAMAGPEKIIEWLKNPCVPNGDLEDDCRLPWQ